MSTEKKTEVVRVLFPDIIEAIPERKLGNAPRNFTLEDLKLACDKIKTGKAPGPDGIPVEAVKVMITEIPDTALAAINEILYHQTFPDEWKSARLVLIHKNGKPLDTPNAYRPLCLEGRATTDALRRVLSIGISVKCGQGVQGDRWSVLVTLDVRNAFNTVRWAEILRELEEKSVSPYLFNIIRDYFINRTIKYDNVVKTTLAGIPQGSVVGPLLWNIFYDPVLRLNYPDGVEAIGFADDLAIMVRFKSVDDLIARTNRSLRMVEAWIRQKGLELAPEKTELVVLSGKRDRSRISLTLGEPSKCVKYLRIHRGQNGYLGTHIQKVTEKAEQRLSLISRLMQNVRVRT